MKKYSELIKLKTFEERFLYLRLEGNVGESTFGHDRYLNQTFYRSNPIWLEVRDSVIIRDAGSDLAMGEDYEILGSIIIHHINPITKEMILNRSPYLYDPENLICCAARTHQAIHYGDKNYANSVEEIVRCPGDTSPWLK